MGITLGGNDDSHARAPPRQRTTLVALAADEKLTEA